MALLKRDDLLKKQELRKERVDLGNGDFVYVRQMTGRERDRFEASVIRRKEDRSGRVTYVDAWEDFRAKLAVNTLCDENGENLLQPGDAATLSQNISAERLELIVNKAQELNRITEADKEELIKNSEAAQSGGSTSDSAEPSATPTQTSSSNS
jgi:hypothetical protein